MSDKPTKEEYAELFNLRVQGMIARMFQVRGDRPSQVEWDFLRGHSDMTMRDIAEIANRLEFDIEFGVLNAETRGERGEDATP